MRTVQKCRKFIIVMALFLLAFPVGLSGPLVARANSDFLLDFINPTPVDNAWINYVSPTIKIETSGDLSAAYLNVLLANGGFEEGSIGYWTGGNMFWGVSSVIRHEGLYSFESSGYSNDYYNNGNSSFGRTVTLNEDGELRFWMRASTEENRDILTFTINGVEKDKISGDVDWTETVIPLVAGTYDLLWTYAKDSTGHSGSDTVWVDDIRINYGSNGEGLSMDIDSVDNNIASYQLPDLIDTTHYYQVTAYDLSSNQAASNIRSFKVDTLAPESYSGGVKVLPINDQNREVSGTVSLSVSLFDDNSYLKNVCLWLGDEVDNLLPTAFSNCKDLNQHSVYSYDYAPDFDFSEWDTTKVPDGQYNLYAIAIDNAGNIGKIAFSSSIKINNYSVGSSVSPAEIRTCQQLQNIGQNPNWHYKVMNDIDCSDTKNWNGGGGFRGVDASNESFSGVLDGQNYIVYNLYQNQQNQHYGNSGIFNNLSGRVSNINFRGVEIICNSTYCGGFSNINRGTIEQSSITGTLTCNGKCGGFASQQSGIISECWADIAIIIRGFSGYSGGIAGSNYNGAIVNSYFKGRVTVANSSGGLVGINEGSTITNSYSVAEVNNVSDNGGLIGWQYSGGNQSGSYWNKETSGLENMCGQGATNCLNESGLTDLAMKQQASFVDWDFENIWAIDPERNDGYPYLQWQTTFSERDIMAPILTLNGDEIIVLALGEEYIEQGATAWDEIYGDISSRITITGGVNINQIGTYYITYDVSDVAGNQANQIMRTVKVLLQSASTENSSNQGEEIYSNPIILASTNAALPRENESFFAELETITETELQDEDTEILSETLPLESKTVTDDIEGVKGEFQENESDQEQSAPVWPWVFSVLALIVAGSLIYLKLSAKKS